MPHAPARICPQCSKPFTGRGCPTCRKPWQGSSYGNSGTTRKQQKIRADQLAREPICQAPGCPHLAVTADHIINRAAGGDLYDRANYQSLCQAHHDAKTQREAQAGRRKKTH